MQEYKGSPALDAGLLATAQAVEHYEISRYGTLRTWAEELGHTDAASLLQETLDEDSSLDGNSLDRSQSGSRSRLGSMRPRTAEFSRPRSSKDRKKSVYAVCLTGGVHA
jgi:hypothetical protein